MLWNKNYVSIVETIRGYIYMYIFSAFSSLNFLSIYDINGLAQYCSISTANAVEILQSYT